MDKYSYCCATQYHLSNISKIRKYLSSETTEILIHAYITSKLDYCNAVLYGLPKCLLNRLQLVQNTAARIVTYTRKYDHITPTLIKLHWLPIQQRIKFKLLLLVYKGLNGLVPSYVSSLLLFCTCTRSLRSSDKELLQVPKSIGLRHMETVGFLLLRQNYGIAYHFL